MSISINNSNNDNKQRGRMNMRHGIKRMTGRGGIYPGSQALMAPCIGHIIDWIIGCGSTIMKYEVGTDKGVCYLKGQERDGFAAAHSIAFLGSLNRSVCYRI